MNPFSTHSRHAILTSVVHNRVAAIAVLLIIAATLALFPPVGLPLIHASQTWTVSMPGDALTTTCPSVGSSCTLRQVILAAANGDTIQFAPGLTSPISLVSANGPLSISQSITINGPGASQLAIDGGGNGGVTVFVVNNGLTVTISGLTVENGNTAGNGGGLVNDRGTVTIQDCVFANNSATVSGGGLFDNLGMVTITNSTFSGNSAGSGGGVYDNGTLTVLNSLFSNNSTGNVMGNKGGGIAGARGNITISNSNLTGNYALNGGGIAYFGNNLLAIQNSTITNNSAAIGSGGGVAYFSGTTLVVQGSTISGNNALFGGGVEFSGINNETLTIQNSTFYGNSATSAGGGLDFNNGYTATIQNSTFYGNSAPGAVEGGIDFDQGILYLGSTIIAGNNTTNNAYDLNNTGGIDSLGYNLIGDGTGAAFTPTSTDQVGSHSNPINPLLSTLDNYGGPTQTLKVLPGSPAISKGNCNLPLPAVPVGTDQRGIFRKNPCDVGAFESGSAPDTVGLYRTNSSLFLLRNSNTTGNADIAFAFQYGSRPYPIAGDWTTGATDTIGLYDQSNGQYFLRNSNIAGTPDEQFVLGNPNDEPIAGQWQVSAMQDGVGVFRPSNGLLLFRNSLSTGFADYVMVLGIPGDQGLADDWGGVGHDGPGVYRPASQLFLPSNTICNCSLYADYVAQLGNPGDNPLTGDWTAQGHAGIGVFRPSNGLILLKNQIATGFADIVIVYGIPNDVPIAGHWTANSPALVKPPNVFVPPTDVPVGTPKPGNNNLGG